MTESSIKVTREELNGILKSLITPNIDEESIQVAIQIIKLGADPDTVSDNGESILFPIMKMDDVNIVYKYAKLLVENGASLTIKNARNKTPIACAIEQGCSLPTVRGIIVQQ